MKYTFAALLLIAALMGGLGWYHQGRLSEAEERQRQLALVAAQHGIGIDPSGTGEIIVTRRPRDNRPPPSRFSADDTMEVIRRMRQAQSQKQPVSPDDRRAFNLMVEQASQLSLSQLRWVVEEISSCEDIPILVRKQLASRFIEAIHADRPEDALKLCMHLPVITSGPGSGSNVFRSALGSWVEADMGNALPWIQQHAKERPDLFDRDAIRIVLSEIANQDRRLAFSLTGELAVGNPNYATQSIVGSAQTAEERIDAIVALREHLLTLESSSDRNEASLLGISALGRRMAAEGFDSTHQWVESAGLTERELSSFGSDLGMSIDTAEAPQWMEYFGTRLTGNHCVRPVTGIMRAWTRDDYVAAGQWLAAAPDGEMKNIAISVYAEESVKLEPQVAEQWADNLPPGDLRSETLRTIYSAWPKNNEASRAAANEFARRHGL